MTVTLTGNIARYLCLHADVASLPTSCPIGSKAREIDAPYNLYIFDGSTWRVSSFYLPANVNWSSIPTSDPHVYGQPFVDESAIVRVSAG